MRLWSEIPGSSEPSGSRWRIVDFDISPAYTCGSPQAQARISLIDDFTMTKKELVKAISEEIELTQVKTTEIVRVMFNSIIDSLITDGRVELRSFGIFELKRREPRMGRNPRTGDDVAIPAKYVVTFKPGKDIEARIGEMEERERIMEAHRRTQQPGPHGPHQKPDSVSSQGDDRSASQ